MTCNMDIHIIDMKFQLHLLVALKQTSQTNCMGFIHFLLKPIKTSQPIQKPIQLMH